MRRSIEGSQAIARAVAMCRPQVVAAYPITPQTHIVEGIARLVADGKAACEIVSVESEFSAASVALGAAATGSRAYCATASQGILLMSEVLYNIAGLRIPLVLTCANRAVGAPINIWNDHQDSMAVRDSGWIQVYCTDNQDAVDTMVQAFRIAERLESPVMVCVDGFILTHLFEAIELPEQGQVDAFLPPYRFSRALDPADPLTLGTLGTPEFFTETRLDLHDAVQGALEEIPAAAEAWANLTGREMGGLIRMTGQADAPIGVLTLGSIYGTLCEALDEHPELAPIRLMALRAFRPFPTDALKAACEGLADLIVLERAISPGIGPIVGTEVRAALSELSKPPRVHSFAVGLGGRNVPLDILPRVVAAAREGRPTRFAIIDADPSKMPAEDFTTAGTSHGTG
jgi:pyruvate ferredoxin oxidoreductase alpha subunit